MSDYILTSDGELMHYGVPGMKWGRRKATKLSRSDTRKRYDSARSDYVQAKKAYNRSFNKAYKYSQRHPISQFVGKKSKNESDRRWDQAFNDAQTMNKAKTQYKQAKRSRKAQLQKTLDKVNKNTSFGERMVYNNATRIKAAKYMVDNNMSMKDAKKKANKEAVRNTALILAACGGYAVYKARR